MWDGAGLMEEVCLSRAHFFFFFGPVSMCGNKGRGKEGGGDSGRKVSLTALGVKITASVISFSLSFDKRGNGGPE